MSLISRYSTSTHRACQIVDDINKRLRARNQSDNRNAINSYDPTLQQFADEYYFGGETNIPVYWW